MPSLHGHRIGGAIGALAAVLVLLQPAPAAAAAGDLDPAFGTAGIARTTFPGAYSGARAVGTQDGGTVAAGFVHADDSVVSDVGLVRYRADGTLDPAFGAGGLVRTDVGGRYDDAFGMAVQADGTVVVVGQSGADMLAARYDRTGALDPSFGAGGTVLVDFGGSEVARDVAVQPDGRIVLVGTVTPDSGTPCCPPRLAVARLTATGEPDPTFDGDGRLVPVLPPGGPTSSEGNAVVVAADGRIAVAGYAVTASGADFVVARFLPGGAPDTSFSADGVVTTDFARFGDVVNDLALDRSGRLVAGGQACEFPGSSDEVCDFGLARYRADGTLDQQFGRRGLVRTDLGADVSEAVRGLSLGSDGSIVAAGDTAGPGGRDVGLVRYRPGGGLDRAFGTRGVIRTAVTDGTDEVGGLTVRAGGGYLVGGTASIPPSSFGFFAAAYLAG